MDKRVNMATVQPDLAGGELAACSAQLIIRALQRLHDTVEIDLDRESIEDYTTLVELGLNALAEKVETAQRTLSSLRSAEGVRRHG